MKYSCGDNHHQCERLTALSKLYWGGTLIYHGRIWLLYSILISYSFSHDKTEMSSTVTRSQFNRAPLGCGGTGDSHHGCAANNLQQLMSYGPKSLRNVYNTLFESMPRRIKAVLKAKGDPTQYYQSVPNKVASATHILCKQKLLFWMWFIAINRLTALIFTA